MMEGMVIDRNDKQLATLAQLQAFLAGTTTVDFAVAADERYDFIARTLEFLKKGITFEQLDVQTKAMSDNDAAQRLNDARAKLFSTDRKKRPDLRACELFKNQLPGSSCSGIDRIERARTDCFGMTKG